jgi:general nucleoside transport system permease protein
MSGLQLRRFAIRFGLGIVPLLVGTLVAVGAIVLLLYVDPNITDVTATEIVVTDEAAVAQVKAELERGTDIEAIAAENPDTVDDYAAAVVLTESTLRRKRLEDFDTAVDEIFSRHSSGTVLGPFEQRRAFYLLRIEDQSIVTLNTIINLIDTRILENSDARANVLDFFLPILLCSCGLLLTFSAGLWNIGIEGQVGMGAVGATSIALFMDMPRTQMIVSAMVIAAAAGGVWALLTAIMRTRAGVNEIFGGVAMNFIASGFSSFLLVGSWGASSGSSTPRFLENALLPRINDQTISPVTIGITVACSVFVLLALTVSRWGLQLRAIGKNEASARVLGIPTERHIWLSMTFCGMMAGLSGAHLVLFTQGRLPANVSGGIGFIALLVVLLASIRVLLVPFIALVFALLTRSSLPLRTTLQVDSALVDVFLGLLVFFVLIFAGLRQRLQDLLLAPSVPDAEPAAPPTTAPQPPPPQQMSAEGEKG